jgi:hypothetical protein
MMMTNKLVLVIALATIMTTLAVASNSAMAITQHHNGSNANGVRGTDANGSNGSNGGIGGAGGAGGVAGNGGSNCVGTC